MVLTDQSNWCTHQNSEHDVLPSSAMSQHTWAKRSSCRLLARAMRKMSGSLGSDKMSRFCAGVGARVRPCVCVEGRGGGRLMIEGVGGAGGAGIQVCMSRHIQCVLHVIHWGPIPPEIVQSLDISALAQTCRAATSSVYWNRTHRRMRRSTSGGALRIGVQVPSWVIANNQRETCLLRVETNILEILMAWVGKRAKNSLGQCSSQAERYIRLFECGD